METAAGFDVVAVVTRLARLRVGAASAEELRWADRATDRVRQVMDAWQSAVQFQMTLPPPLPADPAPTADADDAAPHDTAAAPDADQPAPLPTLGGGAAESPQEALRKLRRMRLLADLPAFLDALAAGRVSTQHVDLLASAVDKLPDAIRIRVLARGEELLRAACAGAADKFSRTVHRVVTKAYEDEGVDRTQRQRAESRLLRGVNDATGMHWLRVDIDPERGAQLFARLDSEREAIFHSGGFSGLNGEQVDLQALLDLLAAPGAEQQSSPRKAHVSVIIDIETLAIGAHDRMVCETSSGAQLPPDTVRNLICAAEIAFGFTVQGRVVRHLANARLATADQRREMRMMHRTCLGHDCDVPFDKCEIHHIVPRSRGGPTDLRLMGPLCNREHDRVHHGGWSVSIDEHRNVIWTEPGGTEHLCPHASLADAGQPALFALDSPAV